MDHPCIPSSGNAFNHMFLPCQDSMSTLIFLKLYFAYTRFMIHLRVRDDSGDAIFTMFNQQTEQLIDTSANKLLNRLGIGSNEYPAEITNLTGRTFAFKIRMPDYFNLDYDFHHHRVVRISEINPLPAAQFPVKAQKKVSLCIITCPLLLPLLMYVFPFSNVTG